MSQKEKNKKTKTSTAYPPEIGSSNPKVFPNRGYEWTYRIERIWLWKNFME